MVATAGGAWWWRSGSASRPALPGAGQTTRPAATYGAAKQAEAWYGRAPRGYQRYAEALRAGSIGGPGAADLLQAVARDGDQPPIARASAIERLGLLPRPEPSRPSARA